MNQREEGGENFATYCRGGGGGGGLFFAYFFFNAKVTFFSRK